MDMYKAIRNEWNEFSEICLAGYRKKVYNDVHIQSETYGWKTAAVSQNNNKYQDIFSEYSEAIESISHAWWNVKNMSEGMFLDIGIIVCRIWW